MNEPADAGDHGRAPGPDANQRHQAPPVLDRAPAHTAAVVDLLVALEPAPAPHELPQRFPGPFDSRRAHPLAARAADQLVAELAATFPGGVPAASESEDESGDERGGESSDDRGAESSDERDAESSDDRGAESSDDRVGKSSDDRVGASRDAHVEGKMFAVLVVQAPDERIGVLRGFSGMLRGRWEVPGFVPPMFEVTAREPWWSEAQAQLRLWDEALQQLEAGAAAVALRAEWAALQHRQVAEAEELRLRHRERRTVRHLARQALRTAEPSPVTATHLPMAAEPSSVRVAAAHALDQESRGDGAERRRHDAAQRAARAPLQARLAELEERHAALSRLRAESSARFQRQLHDLYVVPSWSGDARPLRDLFAPGEPPSGAGDCAGPKLLAYALRAGLRPLALAELWWGPPPLGGGRHHGQLYPACRGKCGPLLPHMLQGLDVEDAPIFGGGAAASDEDDADGEIFNPHSSTRARDKQHQEIVRSPHSLIPCAGNPSALEILYEDEWLVALTKPCGLLSVPGRSAALADSVLTRLRRRFPGATGPLLVHRLDLDTSGLLLAAKDRATHAALQRQFAHREIEKRYVALLDGEVTEERSDRGIIELALRTDLDDRPRQLHDPIHGKPAITRWQMLQRSPGTTRIALFPHTGRTHQLRVHAAHPLGLAVPILGDRLYGWPSDSPRLMLHAERLAFSHPRTGARLELVNRTPF